MRAAFTIIAAALLNASLVEAQELPGDDLARTLDAQPGVAVTHGVEGANSYTEWKKNGVSFRRGRNNGKDDWIGNDESGHGAVMCTWMIFTAVRSALKACPSDRFSELGTDLDRDIPIIEAFIVANSVLPTSTVILEAKANAEAEREAEVAEDNERRMGRSSTPRVCPADGAGDMAKVLDDLGRDGRRKMVDNLLSLSRWPVANPCL